MGCSWLALSQNFPSDIFEALQQPLSLYVACIGLNIAGMNWMDAEMREKNAHSVPALAGLKKS